jgi:hypothetical protein
MKIDTEKLHAALTLLGELMASRQRPSTHLVVCGGSSLLALDLVDRSATRDVDVLASLVDGELQSPRPLPDWFLQDAEDVRSQLDLPTNWINAGPADDSFFRFGFPEGLASRLTERSYGNSFAVSFISRYDQIHFKLYASADQGAGRHLRDLLDLKPAAGELLAAARWTLTQDSSEGFRLVLADLLKHLGRGNLIDQI